MRKWHLLVAASLLACAASASAAPCAGAAGWVFDDVDASEPFCAYATWMALQGVTFGCEVIDDGHRNFCPDSPATRLQMAAFMKRLSDATAPVKAYGSFANNLGFSYFGDFTGSVIEWPTASLVNGLALNGTLDAAIVATAGDYRLHYCVRTFATVGSVTPGLTVNGAALNASNLPAINGAGAGCLDVGASLAAGDAVRLVLNGALAIVTLQSPGGAELFIERIGP